MKIIKKITTLLMAIITLLVLTGCGNYESKAKKNIDGYMKEMMSLTSKNYTSWLSENVVNPYLEIGIDLDELDEGEAEYFIKCLSMIEYEITDVDETNMIAEVSVKYVDSTEFITNLLTELIAYAFSEDYTDEGVNQIYLDVMNGIEEYQFVDDTLYFALDDKAEINFVSENIFDVATAGLYKLMLSDSGNTSQESQYSEEELLANIDMEYEIIDINTILVKITNNNDVPVYPTVYFNFSNGEDENIIQSQANIEVLPAHSTNYASAYNELSDENSELDVEMSVDYYNPEDITFFDETLVPYEITQNEDEVDITFTNNTDEVIDICGGYIVYGEDDSIVYVGDIYVSGLGTGDTDTSWFYLNSTYDESTDTWVTDPYSRIEVYPIAHTYASYIWAN